MNKILKMLNYKTKWIDDSGYTPTYTGAFNFMNGASQSNEYTYDKNGNLTKDLNKTVRASLPHTSTMPMARNCEPVTRPVRMR